VSFCHIRLNPFSYPFCFPSFLLELNSFKNFYGSNFRESAQLLLSLIEFMEEKKRFIANNFNTHDANILLDPIRHADWYAHTSLALSYIKDYEKAKIYAYKALELVGSPFSTQEKVLKKRALKLVWGGYRLWKGTKGGRNRYKPQKGEKLCIDSIILHGPCITTTLIESTNTDRRPERDFFWKKRSNCDAPLTNGSKIKPTEMNCPRLRRALRISYRSMGLIMIYKDIFTTLERVNLMGEQFNLLIKTAYDEPVDFVNMCMQLSVILMLVKPSMGKAVLESAWSIAQDRDLGEDAHLMQTAAAVSFYFMGDMKRSTEAGNNYITYHESRGNHTNALGGMIIMSHIYSQLAYFDFGMEEFQALIVEDESDIDKLWGGFAAFAVFKSSMVTKNTVESDRLLELVKRLFAKMPEKPIFRGLQFLSDAWMTMQHGDEEASFRYYHDEAKWLKGQKSLHPDVTSLLGFTLVLTWLMVDCLPHYAVPFGGVRANFVEDVDIFTSVSKLYGVKKDIAVARWTYEGLYAAQLFIKGKKDKMLKHVRKLLETPASMKQLNVFLLAKGVLCGVVARYEQQDAATRENYKREAIDIFSKFKGDYLISWVNR
jgi:hypothetical protein